MLVHEAYLRLVDVDEPQQSKGRGHFFGAVAEANAANSGREGSAARTQGANDESATTGKKSIQLLTDHPRV
jgi:hypothetical protein